MLLEPAPLIPGFEDVFGQFANGTMAAATAEHSIGLTPHREAGIRWCHQQSHVITNGQIIEVIADESRGGDSHSELVLESLQGCRFVFDSHHAVVDSELPCSHLRGTSFAAAEEGQSQSSFL